MSFVSKAQNAWAHTSAGTKALGGEAKVKEWESDTDYSSLPDKTSDSKPSETRKKKFSFSPKVKKKAGYSASEREA